MEDCTRELSKDVQAAFKIYVVSRPLNDVVADENGNVMLEFSGFNTARECLSFNIPLPIEKAKNIVNGCLKSAAQYACMGDSYLVNVYFQMPKSILKRSLQSCLENDLAIGNNSVKENELNGFPDVPVVFKENSSCTEALMAHKYLVIFLKMGLAQVFITG